MFLLVRKVLLFSKNEALYRNKVDISEVSNQSCLIPQQPPLRVQ